MIEQNFILIRDYISSNCLEVSYRNYLKMYVNKEPLSLISLRNYSNGRGLIIPFLAFSFLRSDNITLDTYYYNLIFSGEPLEDDIIIKPIYITFSNTSELSIHNQLKKFLSIFNISKNILSRRLSFL